LADVQTENGYTRIATELMNEIIRRDFSKRQLSILHLLIRLSYGCQQKDCIIEKLNAFEIAGVYKSDISKELSYLSNAKVINWDKKERLFSVNKNYENWQINPTKGWDDDKFNLLIHANIKRKKVSEIPTEEGSEVSKTLTDLESLVSKTLTNLGEEVSKTLTQELVKHLLDLLGNAWESKDEDTLKDIIKDIYLKITKEEEEEVTTVERILELLQKSKILEGKDITEFLRDDIDDVINNFGFTQPEEMIIEAIKDAARGNGRTWKYVYMKLVAWKKKGIKNLQDLETGKEQGDGDGKVKQYRSGFGRSAKESKSSEQAYRELEESKRAWGG
jgi:phage replication O-like protein O